MKMPKYNGKNYVTKLVRANKSHKCAATGAPIKKGEHYCHLTVDEGGPLRRGKHGSEYHKDTILRLHLAVLATVEFEAILESLDVFRNNDTLIKKLEETNESLRHNLDMAAIVKKQLQADLEKTVSLLKTETVALERHIIELKSQLNSVYGAQAVPKAADLLKLRNMTKTGNKVHDLITELMNLKADLREREACINKGLDYVGVVNRIVAIEKRLLEDYNIEVKL
jgi:hypothetical protein